MGNLTTALGSLESTAGDWAICVPPINMNWNEYTGILVNRDSPNKDALGPLIEWLTLDCSETGLQYELLNDTLYNNKYYGGFGLPIVSGTIYKNNDCSIDFLGGQNIYPVIYDALNAKTGRRFSNDFFGLWLDEVRAYLNGEKDRETAVADYKKTEKERISWYKKRFEDDNITFLMKGRHEQFPY